MQNRLLALGYWLPGVTGVYDYFTQQAVYAFQKYNDLPRTGSFDLVELVKLGNADRPVPRSTSGYVIEIDKTRQVLIVANNGHADWVFNASSGSDHPYVSEGVRYTAHTPEGNFNVIRSVERVRQEPARPAVPAEVLHQHRDRGARVHRRAAVPGVARLRPGVERRDGLHLEREHHADRHHGLGLSLSQAQIRRPGRSSNAARAIEGRRS